MFAKTSKHITHFWKTTPLYLQLIFLFAFIISVFFAVKGLQTGVIFSYDQARDAIESRSIYVNHHIKILGPSTDIPGVFHGVLWYYLLAFVYFIVGSPELTAVTFCIFLFLTTPFVGLLAEDLFENRKVTIIAMVLYMLSPIFQTASHWLSNPIPSFLVSPLLLLLIWRYMKWPTVWKAIGIGVCYGIIIQAEFAYLLLLITVPIYCLLLRLKISLKTILGFMIGLVATLGSFVIAEIKFHGQGIKGMMEYIQKGTPHHTLPVVLSQIWDRLSELYAVTFFSYPKGFISITLLFTIILLFISFFKQNRKSLILLSVWLLGLLLFLLSGTGIATSYFLFFPFVCALIIFISFFTITYTKYFLLGITFVIIFAYSQLHQSQFYLQTNTSPLPAQQGATLNIEKQIIHYTYDASNKQPFTIVTITNPLYIDTTWAYLYSYYGKNWYGYVPNYGGRGQTNIFGENLLPEIPFGTNYRYLIEEPPDGLATIYITKIIYEEDKVSNIVETKHFGRYIVQKRILVHNKLLPPIPDELKGKPILYE